MLCIIRGLPGSGKSTFASRSFPGAFHIENDMLHITNGKYEFREDLAAERQKKVKDIVREVLNAGADVIISNVFPSPKKLKDFIQMAKDVGTDCSIFRMTGNFMNRHSVPEKVLAAMKSQFRDIPVGPEWPVEIFVKIETNGEYSLHLKEEMEK